MTKNGASIGVWRAKSDIISFLNSCGVIYEKIENESLLCDFSHVFLFEKVSSNFFKKEQTILDFTQKKRKKFVLSFMLSDEQVDVFSFVENLSLITSIPMNLTRQFPVIRKGYFVGQKKLPAEEIPLRDLGGLQRLFILLLKRLFHSQGLPLTLKSFSPDPEKIPLLFRVDTDFCDRDTIENYYADIKCKETLKTSWFVHCNGLIDSGIFKAGESDEFALHCFSHKVKPTNENLEKGIEFLVKNGKTPFGYSAPYGVRRVGADVFLRQRHNFEYSSDFSFAADALPFWVEETKLWQIPIFPLCVGSFRSVCTDERKITAVFERYFARQFRYKIPFVIYDHPDHKEFSLLNKIFEAANKYPILPMTFLEYARFLQERKNASVNSDFPTITFYPEKTGEEITPLPKISRFSPRLIKNTIINRLYRRTHKG
ncbi:MAG: hypothetical protein FWE23_06795 [Chitinivibrionia bacterium]|nr:hypothetical protein [Chitinivibrionia bacterium]